ncbi:hypothetical protein, partial [Bacillus sonorensis]|uniref:hypothetical protein n=1 Tax=Bacillus sonorensis TaxID=119858 RepID=UPI001C71799D
ACFFHKSCYDESNNKTSHIKPSRQICREGILRFGNFEKRCLFTEKGAPFPGRLLPKDFHRGVSLLDRLASVAVNLVMASIAETFKV